jgi:hypothetical protein
MLKSGSGVDDEIRPRFENLTKSRERGVYAVSAELSPPAGEARPLCVAGGFGDTAYHRRAIQISCCARRRRRSFRDRHFLSDLHVCRQFAGDGMAVRRAQAQAHDAAVVREVLAVVPDVASASYPLAAEHVDAGR